MANSNISVGNRWLFLVFSILWFALVFFTYWGYHPYYSLAIGRAINWDIAAVLLLLCGGVGYWLVRSQKKKSPTGYNGLMLYGFLLLLQTVTIAIYGSKQNLFPDGAAAGIGYFIVFSLLMHAAIFLIVLLHYAIGHALLERLARWYHPDSHALLSIAVGVSVLGLLMVILGQFGLLYGPIIWGLGLAAAIWQRQAVLAFLKRTLWEKKPRKEQSALWLAPPFLLLIAVAINSIAAIKVAPIGFDGTALYMNITQLIAESHALPEGGQAYNWSVFMSLGKLLYGQMSLSILLSHFSGLLAILVLYRLARLFVAAPGAWLAASLFYLYPAVNFHLTLDEKVDLGFLFITLSTVLLLVEYFVKRARKKEDHDDQVLVRLGKVKLTTPVVIWLLAGWLSGYAFGIKYTGIMSLFALLSYLVYQRAGTKAGVGAMALLTSLLFLLGIYRFGYTELSGSSPLLIGLVALAVAIPLLVLGLRNQQQALRPIGFFVLVFLSGAGLAFAPWMGKHLSETKQFSLSGLIQGQSPRPELNVGLPVTSTTATDPFQEAMKIVDRRGLVLDAKQQQQLRNLLNEYDWAAANKEQRLTYAKTVRRRVVREVLTPQQIAQAGISQLTGMSGVGEASLLEGAKREEIKRYIGYEKGLPLFLSLPYDVTMNTNVRYLKYLDISFLFLLLLPILMFSYQRKGALGLNIGLVVLTLLVWSLSVYSVYAVDGVSPLDVNVRNAAEEVILKHLSAFQPLLSGVFVGTQSAVTAAMASLHGLYTAFSSWSFLLVFIVLTILAGLCYIFFRERLAGLSTNFKGVMAFTFAFGYFWVLLGSAIVWYALPVFALLSLLMAFSVYKPEKAAGPRLLAYSRYYLAASVGLFLFLATALNFMSTTEAEEQADVRYQRSFIKYATSSMDAEEAMYDFNPYFVETARRINRDPASKVYRVGTYLNYHIDQNDSRVYEDNQLELFGTYMEQNRDPRGFLRFLKENGFDYVLYDLNTPALDKTPEQSLAKKGERFYALLRSAPNAQLAFTDNLVEASPDRRTSLGRVTLPGRLDIDGTPIFRGSFALFELQ